MSSSGIVRACVLAAGAGALALSVGAMPVHQGTRSAAQSASKPVTAARLLCPGASAAAGGSAAPRSVVAVASAPMQLDSMLRRAGTVWTSGADQAHRAVSLSRGSSQSLPVGDGVLSVGADGVAAPGLSATQFRLAQGVLASRPCSAATSESWIPVGDKQAGRLLTLVLVNEGSHAASVDVDVRGADGDVPGAAVVDEAVPAHSRVELNLPIDAVAHAAPVVHVRSEGGIVQAGVRDTAGSGATQGVEETAQYAVASTSQSVPAVPVRRGSARVRLAAPESRDLVVRLQAWNDGQGASRDTVVTIPAGRSRDVAVTGLTGRFAALRATAERPLVMAAQTSPDPAAKDFVWSPAAPDLGPAAGVSVSGSGAGGLLSVMSDGQARTVKAVVSDPSGHSRVTQLRVPTGGSATLPIAKDENVWLSAKAVDGSSGLHATVLVGDGGWLTSATAVPLVAAPWARVPIEVVQR